LRSQTHFRLYRGRRVLFSCFALPDSFSMVPRTSGLVCIFCTPELVFDGFEGVGSHLHVLHSRIHFGRYRGRQVTVSYFVLPNPFWAVPRASGPVFMFCTTRLVFTVPRAPSPVFKFCAPRLIFDGTEDVGSRLHVLRTQTHFRRYRGGWVPFSCFALPDSFSTVSRTSGPVCMFCAPILVYDGTLGPVFMFCGPVFVLSGTDDAGSYFHVLRSRSRFGQYRGRRVQFSLSDLFWAVPRALRPIFMFCGPGVILSGTEDAGSSFHVLRTPTHLG
jgi:hypothetical protein